MTGGGTEDVIEWRATPGWALRWLAFLVFVALPFLAFGGWLAVNEIGRASEGTWPLYIFFLQAFTTIVLGILTFATLAGVAAHVMLLVNRRPVVRADRNGLLLYMPLRPTRTVPWTDIKAIEIERTRQVGRRLVHYNQLLVRLRDDTTLDLAIRPQMAGLTLEAGHDALTRLQARFR